MHTQESSDNSSVYPHEFAEWCLLLWSISWVSWEFWTLLTCFERLSWKTSIETKRPEWSLRQSVSNVEVYWTSMTRPSCWFVFVVSARNACDTKCCDLHWDHAARLRWWDLSDKLGGIKCKYPSVCPDEEQLAASQTEFLLPLRVIQSSCQFFQRISMPHMLSLAPIDSTAS